MLILFLEAALLLSVASNDLLATAIRNSIGLLTPLPAHSPIIVKTPVRAPLIPAVRPASNFKMLAQYTFDNSASLKQWEEKIFKGSTQFQVLSDKGSGFLKSKSSDACSGLYVKVDYPATPDLCVSWKWRAVLFPKKQHTETISNKSEDDFAARVYVIFPGANFFKSDVIEYIWDEKTPVNTTASSPYSDRIKLFVLRSGPAPVAAGGWYEEERNVYEDYEKLFGKAPAKPVGAIALMSDSDNTRTSSEADFGTVIIEKKLTR